MQSERFIEDDTLEGGSITIVDKYIASVLLGCKRDSFDFV